MEWEKKNRSSFKLNRSFIIIFISFCPPLLCGMFFLHFHSLSLTLYRSHCKKNFREAPKRNNFLMCVNFGLIFLFFLLLPLPSALFCLLILIEKQKMRWKKCFNDFFTLFFLLLWTFKSFFTSFDCDFFLFFGDEL